MAITVALLLWAGEVQAAKEINLANFSGTDETTGPFSSLVFDSHGNLFGTTSVGEGKFRKGFVFEISPPVAGSGRWTKTDIYDFDGPSGNEPYSGALIIDAAGDLYGTTAKGGRFGEGTVYRLSPPSPRHTGWVETVLHSFTGKDGNLPIGVAIDAAGNLYGTTDRGGSDNDGTVFKLSPPARQSTVWTLTTLHSFGSGLSNPSAGVILDKAGNLYGTVHGGSRGGVFRLSPPMHGDTHWTFTSLHEFLGGVGEGPNGGLVFDGKGDLYGATSGNGSVNHGVVFRLTPPVRGSTRWTYGALRAFNHTDGDFPGGGNLIFDKAGNLYGTTDGAGGQGNVFMLSPPEPGETAWRETVLHSFMGGTGDGCFPWGSVILDRSGKNIYGTTQGCGLGNGGTVYEIELSTP